VSSISRSSSRSSNLGAAGTTSEDMRELGQRSTGNNLARESKPATSGGKPLGDVPAKASYNDKTESKKSATGNGE
jgi:hypothetical protein